MRGTGATVGGGGWRAAGASLVGALAVGAALAGCASTGATTAATARAGVQLWPERLDHPTTPATHRQAVDELFVAMDVERTFAQAVESSMRIQIDANPVMREFAPVIREFLARYMGFGALRERIAGLYMERFSELEIRQLTAFYRTTLGVRALQELPALMQRGGEIGAAQVREHSAELQDMIRAHLERTPRGGAAPAPSP